MSSLRGRVARLEKLFPKPSTFVGYGQYVKDPLSYVREVLKKDLWSVQIEICRKLLEPPWKVLVKSAHSTGKTFLAACIALWFYDCFDPSATVTTAPSYRDVKALLWREIRLLRGKRGGFRGGSATELFSSPEHYCVGFTSDKQEGFQGRHQTHQLFLFDEANGIDPFVFETVRSMFKPGGLHHWCCIFNPTSAASAVHEEEQNGTWTTITMSALDHPNILNELAGLPPPFPAAVSLAQVNEWLTVWSDPVPEGDQTHLDIQWPPGSGKWIRPSPLAESRVLGRWPSQDSTAVWSDALWQSVLATRHAIKDSWPVQIGVDVARYGDDFTAIHVRKGFCSLWHESHNGWSTAQTAGRIKQLANQFQDAHNVERSIPCLIDVGGVGAGVIDQAGEHQFVAINSSSTHEDDIRQPERCQNLRSELWMGARDCARAGLIDVSRLDSASRREIGRQLLAPKYQVLPTGKIKVEDKDETKKLLKRSPDDGDALNLCFLAYTPATETVAGRI